MLIDIGRSPWDIGMTRRGHSGAFTMTDLFALLQFSQVGAARRLLRVPEDGCVAGTKTVHAHFQLFCRLRLGRRQPDQGR